MNKLVHIERAHDGFAKYPPLCGSKENNTDLTTFRSVKLHYEFTMEPTCEACILIAWASPEKVFVFE